MRTKLAIPCLLVLLGWTISASAQEETPDPSTLPDVFTSIDGQTIDDPADWPARREELKSLFETEVYGHLPPNPDSFKLSVRETYHSPDLSASISALDLSIGYQGNSILLDASVAWPDNSEAPPPVVIQCRWRGFGPEAQDASLEKDIDRLKTYLNAGYAVLEFDYQSLVPDKKETYKTGNFYRLYGEDIDTGTLMAWAWGMHRMVDAAEKLDQVDASKTIVTGHSRLGKTALVAGAFDERIALTLPNHSGCAGVAPYRLIYGNNERLQNIAGFAPHWFRPNFYEYADRVETLPVDQHMLLALVAPRALLNCEGTEDNWTNPQGAQESYLAARPVFKLLDAEHLQSIRYRQVGHVPNPVDLIEYADHIFRGKPLPEDFGKLPY